MAQRDRQEVVGQHGGEEGDNPHVDVGHGGCRAEQQRGGFHGGNRQRQAQHEGEEEHPLHHRHGRIFRGDGAGDQQVRGVKEDVHETEQGADVAVVRVAVQGEKDHHEGAGDAEEDARGLADGDGLFQEEGSHEHHHQRGHGRDERHVGGRDEAHGFGEGPQRAVERDGAERDGPHIPAGHLLTRREQGDEPEARRPDEEPQRGIGFRGDIVRHHRLGTVRVHPEDDIDGQHREMPYPL